MISNVSKHQEQTKSVFGADNSIPGKTMAKPTTTTITSMSAKSNSNTTVECLSNNNTKNLQNKYYSNSLDNRHSLFDNSIELSLEFENKNDDTTTDSQKTKDENVESQIIHASSKKNGRLLNGEYLNCMKSNFQTTNLHNYSKVPDNDSNNNNARSNFMGTDEDDDNETNEFMDDNNNTNNKTTNVFDNDISDVDKTPDHHARRPMNAFLIFCKRHRALVREKYPNLENRSITKILGDWWAFLSKEQKTSYTNLAKQYKDAFFTANPTFKWYKLPAPPLRTLSTRPTNDRSVAYPSNASNGNGQLSCMDFKTFKQNEFTNLSEFDSMKSNRKIIKKSSVGQFKLADESEMGGLSSLLNMQSDGHYKSAENDADQEMSAANYHSDDKETSAEMKEDEAEGLTNADDDSPTANSDPFANMKIHAQKSQKRGNDDTPTLLFIDNKMQKMSYDEKLDADDDTTRKSNRRCKGNLYQRFMIPSAKKSKLDKNKMNTNYSTHTAEMMMCKSELHTVNKMEKPTNLNEKERSEFVERSYEMQLDYSEGSTMRTFDSTNFNLDEKIQALPGLDLDEYLMKKKESKKKKKISNKPRIKFNAVHKQSLVSEHQTVVGSQKRKARKDTIKPRRVDTATTASTGSAGGVPDLFGLATLAEVAAQESKLNEDKN